MLAGVVCLLIIAALILSLGPYVAPLPIAALTAIVILVGWKMIDFSFLRKIRRMDAKYSSVMLLTMGATIFVDPFFAIVLGVIAANIVNASRIEALELDSVVSVPILDSTFDPAAETFDAHVGLLAFRGTFTVSSSRKLIRQAGDDIRDHDVVIFDFSGTTHVDDSAANVIAVLVDRAKQTGTEVVVCGDTSRPLRLRRPRPHPEGPDRRNRGGSEDPSLVPGQAAVGGLFGILSRRRPADAPTAPPASPSCRAG